MTDTEQAELCGHTKAEHIDLELKQWPEAQVRILMMLLSAAACKFAHKHWDQWMEEGEFQPETMQFMDPDWFVKNIVRGQAEAAGLLETMDLLGLEVAAGVVVGEE